MQLHYLAAHPPCPWSEVLHKGPQILLCLSSQAVCIYSWQMWMASVSTISRHLMLTSGYKRSTNILWCACTVLSAPLPPSEESRSSTACPLTVPVFQVLGARRRKVPRPTFRV